MGSDAALKHRSSTGVAALHGYLMKLLSIQKRGRGRADEDKKQGVLTENLWPKLFSEAPRCAPLRLF